MQQKSSSQKSKDDAIIATYCHKDSKTYAFNIYKKILIQFFNWSDGDRQTS